MMVQSNEIVFFICLMGIFSFLKKKENWAIIFFALATGIKVWPVFFFFWLLIRGSKMTLAKSIFAGVFIVFLPFLFGNGLNNLETFLKVLSQISVQGKSEITYANQSLGATLFRLFTVYPPEMGKYIYTVWDLGIETADILFKISFFTIILLMVGSLVWAKKIGNKLLFIEPCIIFLAAHLISGKCFKAHLVTLSLVYMAIFMISFKKSKTGQELMLLALLLAFTGKELYGEKIQFLIGGWGFWTWLMMLSFSFLIFTLSNSFTRNHR